MEKNCFSPKTNKTNNKQNKQQTKQTTIKTNKQTKQTTNKTNNNQNKQTNKTNNNQNKQTNKTNNNLHEKNQPIALTFRATLLRQQSRLSRTELQKPPATCILEAPIQQNSQMSKKILEVSLIRPLYVLFEC